MTELIGQTGARSLTSRRLRALVRSRESSLVILAGVVGVVGGLVVAAMSAGVDLLHAGLFHLTNGERLSAQLSLNPLLAVLVPTFGGLIFGIAAELIAIKRPKREVDPIEANALYGGRMSILGSLIVSSQTVWSSGVGASVGLEAGYTQLASGIASRLGVAFRLRRADLRILVGCGAAAGIAGAFHAPLAGAFYGFELIIGGYTPVSLAPVGISALIGYLVAHFFEPGDLGIVAPDITQLAARDLIFAVLAGLFSAMVGVVLMRCVARCERIYVRMRIRPSLRTMSGGFLVGLMALSSPQIMSSGHGALHMVGSLDLSVKGIAIIFLLKICASIVSLGAGFRGGLFFSSLLLGALGGHLLALIVTEIQPLMYIDTNAAQIIGMSALTASVIGGPLTMTFIALESTGDLWLTPAVLIAVIISVQVTRETFGYSFATWRFHLRGETIRSATDIGWMRDLTAGKMMRSDVKTVSEVTAIAAFRNAFPAGSTAYVAAVDRDDRYAGLVMVADAHSPDISTDKSIKEILHYKDDVILPGMQVREAVLAFDRAEAEALAVVDSLRDRRVVGILTEAYVLRRYTAALEGNRRDLGG